MYYKLLKCLNLGILLSSIVLLGCGQKSKHQADPVVESYRLIDDDRADEAIASLENLLTQEQDIEKLKTIKLALASAYAHKAGVRVQNLVKMLKQVGPLEKLEKSRKEQNLQSEPENMNELQLLDYRISKFALSLRSASAVVDFYNSIPILESKEHISYLKNAISILEDIADIKPEDALYRGILRIIIFKQQIAEMTVPTTQDFEPDQECTPDLIGLSSKVDKIGKTAMDVLTDVSIASPKQVATYSKVRNEIYRFKTEFSALTTVTTTLEEISRSIRDSSIVKQLGIKLQCTN